MKVSKNGRTYHIKETIINLNSLRYNILVETTKVYSFHPTKSNAKSLVLLGHGVNLNPEKMNDLLEELNLLGHDVVKIALAGHRPGETQMICSSSLWTDEFLQSFNFCKEISIKKSYPLNFVGYSLSALIALNLEIQKLVQFDKKIFLAPALELKQITKVMKLMTKINYLGKLPVMPDENLHINSFKALFELQEDFQKNKENTPNTKTLVMTRKSDEVISYENTLKLINKYSLNSWTLKELDNSKKVKVQHFCFDKNCMNDSQWNNMIKDFSNFFNEFLD